METLYVIISTFNDRAENLINVLLEPENKIIYVISHQITKRLKKNTEYVIEKIKSRKDVIYSPISSTGLSNNRNNALKLISNGIVLCSDDDVKFYKDTFKNVIRSFTKYPQADIITFKIKTPCGKDFKHYPDNFLKHNFKTIFRVGSVEIAFRVKKIKDANLSFDEKFGVGSDKYQVGEEYIFLSDALKKRLNCYFLPIPILIHPLISTGDSLEEKIIYSRGAVLARTYDKFSYFMDFLFAIKKYPNFKKKIGFGKYLKLMIKGSKSYLK